ncbi:MAG: hypothetical protein ACR2O0_00425 [Rhizobiaceae bacterium]
MRKELNELRKERAAAQEKETVSDNSQTKNEASSDKSFEDLIGDAKSDAKVVLKDIAELGEKEIEKNPLLAIGLAFLVGLLIGRTSKG